jgi:hypothetical protein
MIGVIFNSSRRKEDGMLVLESILKDKGTPAENTLGNMQDETIHPGYSDAFLKLRGALKTVPLERPSQGSLAEDCPREPF